jgi:large subunit ribosomal protein L25
MAKNKKTKKVKGSTPKAKSNRPVLKVQKRSITGRKVKNLRDQALIPAIIYGREIDSLNVKIDLHDFNETFKRVGETSLVDVKVKGEKKKRPVLLKNFQYHPINDQLIHLDLHQVDLSQKVTAEVPVELVGKSPAAESGEGVLVQLVDQLEVEALPTELPDKFIVDVSELEEVDDAVTIADLEKVSKDVEIKTEKDQILAKVEPLLEEIEEPVTPEEELLVDEEDLVEGEEMPEEEAPGEEELPEEESQPEKPDQE